MRIDVRKTKRLVWFANVIALLAVSFAFWYILEQKKNDKFKSRPAAFWREMIDERSNAISTEDDSGARARRGRDFFASIASLNVTGQDPTPPEVIPETAPTPVETKRSLDPITEVLAIEMVVAPIMASILYKKEEDAKTAEYDDQYVRPGFSLVPPYHEEPFNGKVISITPEFVTFAWGGEEVTVPVGGEAPAEVVGRGGPNKTKPNVYWDKPEPPENTLSLDGDRVWVFSEKDQDDWAENHNAFLEQDSVRFSQQRNRTTNKDELVLSHVNSTGRLSKFGFRGGDTLVSINGVPISSKSQAVNYFKGNPDEPSYEVRFKRLGAEMSRVFTAPKRK